MPKSTTNQSCQAPCCLRFLAALLGLVLVAPNLRPAPSSLALLNQVRDDTGLSPPPAC
ncbi:hypothetical protein [Pseudomonas aeruginosa]|uniref:hypothetical protein n=1 Tax=Pseudomonas aeruginosa TaxID=287 RepID=UPI003D9C57A4